MEVTHCINSPREIGVSLTQIFDQMKLTQAAVAVGAGVHQSQVSRILAGDFRRYSTNVERICKYANLSVQTNSTRPVESKRLMDALNAVWDGTDEHAEVIAQILNAVGKLRTTKRSKISLE